MARKLNTDDTLEKACMEFSDYFSDIFGKLLKKVLFVVKNKTNIGYCLEIKKNNKHI